MTSNKLFHVLKLSIVTDKRLFHVLKLSIVTNNRVFHVSELSLVINNRHRKKKVPRFITGRTLKKTTLEINYGAGLGFGKSASSASSSAWVVLITEKSKKS